MGARSKIPCYDSLISLRIKLITGIIDQMQALEHFLSLTVVRDYRTLLSYNEYPLTMMTQVGRHYDVSEWDLYVTTGLTDTTS